MEYKVLECKWDDQYDFQIMAQDANSYCHVYIYYDDPTTAYVGDLYVDESIRKQGRAKNLLRYVENFVEKRGCDKLMLRVKINTPWLREWYEREGFEIYSGDEEPEYVWYKKKIILKN